MNARVKAPNVVIVVLDDLGFAQLGCFGSDIATPNIDRLAAGGLRYNRFHVTALCSPTRAALLTGRNHHRVGMGMLTDLPLTHPGYTGRIPDEAAAMPRLLRDAGYNTFAVGKWHLAPRYDLTAAGPFDRWPLGLGFERYYGFLGGDTNQWTPSLVCDNHQIEPPRTPEEGYHLTEDLADQALRMVTDQQHVAPHKPFFLYFATGAMHAPHHVAEEWIRPYEGKFDDGWERWRERTFARQIELGVVPAGARMSERPEWVQAWDELPEAERRFYARTQEVYAGFLSHTDHQIGRIIDGLERLGVLDDTIFMVISDNGASAEGGLHGSLNEMRFGFGFPDDLEANLARIDDVGGYRAYNHYAWGWAWAGNTPFRLWKRYAWLGGTRTPLIVHWPNGFAARGEVRSQFCHAVDLLPTVLDAAGLELPAQVGGVAQMSLDGASLRPTFDAPDAKSPRDVQYFEMLGSRSIIRGDWKATTDHVSQGVIDEDKLLPGSRDFATDRWSLFDLSTDFAETTDVADRHPDVLRELQQLWWHEAGRNQVLPLSDGLQKRIPYMAPSHLPHRTRVRFYAGAGPVADEAVPIIMGGATIAADVDVPASGAEGVLCAQGDWSSGWALIVKDGRLSWLVNIVGDLYRVDATDPVPSGRTLLGVRYVRNREGGGKATLFAGPTVLGTGTIPTDLPFRWQITGNGLSIGYDRGFPVSDDYTPPFPWTGTLRSIEFVLPGHPEIDPEDELRQILVHE
mgnify:CR=1 FL=1